MAVQQSAVSSQPVSHWRTAHLHCRQERSWSVNPRPWFTVELIQPETIQNYVNKIITSYKHLNSKTNVFFNKIYFKFKARKYILDGKNFKKNNNNDLVIKVGGEEGGIDTFPKGICA